MRKTILTVCFCALSAILAGCSSQMNSFSAIEGNQGVCSLPAGERGELTGTLIIGHEVRTFQPAGCSDRYWVIDQTGELYARYDLLTGGVKNGRPVQASLIVENLGQGVDGFAKQYASTLKVYEIVSMTSDH